MAKKSLFTKKGLKSLFSQSEANLKDRLEKNDQGGGGKTFKFPKLKKKKTTDKGVVVEETDADRTKSAGGRDEELGLDVTVDQSVSLYGTAPRSKRVLHASESDLRKPRKFGTLLFSWRKKKKGTDLPFQTSEVAEDCLGHEEQGVSEADPALWISSPSEEASGTTKVGAEAPKLTQVLTNVPSIHTCPSQAQDSLTDPSPAEEPGKKSFLPLSQESFDDQPNITLPASVTNKDHLGESPGRPTAPPPKEDSEPFLPHRSPLQIEVPQYKTISETKPVVPTYEAALPKTGCVTVKSTKTDEIVTGVTPEQPDSCALSPNESFRSATETETRPCSGSPSSQVTITEFHTDTVLSNNDHGVTKPNTSENYNLVSDVAFANADINVPQADITDVIYNSPSDTAELATDIISPNTETLVPECEIIETTVDITALDSDTITNAVSTDITISKEDNADAVATSTYAELATDMIPPSPDTLVTTDTANPDSADIKIPKADVIYMSADVNVTTSDTTVLPSADIMVPNPTMSSPTAEIMSDTTRINTPYIPTVNQNLTKLCTSGNDKLTTNVAVQNTDIANLKAGTTDEVALRNGASKGEALATDMVFNAKTHTLECEITENTADITAPNPDIVSDAISSDINIPKADLTSASADFARTASETTESLSANIKVHNPTASPPSTEMADAITDINILNNSTLVDQSFTNPSTSSDDKLVSNISIPNADITIPKADVTDALASSTSDTAKLPTDMFSPNTEITMSECKIAETTVNILASDPDIISNADSTDITIPQEDITDVIANSATSGLEPAAGMISITTDTLIPECEITQTPADTSDLDPKTMRRTVGPDISFSKADITFTSADVAIATCETIEHLSPDTVVSSSPVSTLSMENAADTTNINIPNISTVDQIVERSVISDISADITADSDMIINAVSTDIITHKADVDEIASSTSSVAEPASDMISTTNTLLPECEITDTVTDEISHGISISKADITFTSADVAIATCDTTEHLSPDIVADITADPDMISNAVSTDITTHKADVVDEIANSTSSVVEPATDMISTTNSLLPECEITDTVSDEISHDISISKADITFTSTDVAVATCETIEHLSPDIVVPSSPVSTLSMENAAATTGINIPNISTVDQIDKSVISDKSADITADPDMITKAVSTDIATHKADVDEIANSTSSVVGPATDMISTTNTLLTECEITDTVSDEISHDISISKADITFTSADVAIATCDTTEHLSPDIVADITADPDMITNAVSTDITTYEADVIDEIANSTSSVVEPATDMISTTNSLLPECEITDTVSDEISHDISISKADITCTSTDVAVATCETIEHLSPDTVVPSSTVSTLSMENAADTTGINIPNISTVDQIDKSVISDKSADITADPDMITKAVSTDIATHKADVDEIANSTYTVSDEISHGISISKADITFTSADVAIATCDTTEHLSPDIVADITADPDMITNAVSTDITTYEADVIDEIANSTSSVVGPATDMISTTNTLLTECEITDTVSDEISHDISISKADITFTSADVAIATCDTTEHLSPDIVADITADPDMITNAVSTDITTYEADVIDEIANSTSSVVEPSTDMISTTNNLLPECEITDTVSDEISHDIRISEADITFTSADVAVASCDIIEQRSDAIVVPSSPVSTLSMENAAATTDIDASEISAVDQIAHNSVISDTLTDITAGLAAVTTSPEGETPPSSGIPFSNGDTDSASTDITCTEADTSHTTADSIASCADTTDVHTDIASSVRHNNITYPDDNVTSSFKLSSANVIFSSNTSVSGNDFETETCSSSLPQHNLCELDLVIAECPDSEPALLELAAPEPAALACFPQATDSSITAPDLPGPDLTRTIASSSVECSAATVSAIDGNVSRVEFRATSFAHSSPPALKNLIFDSNYLRGMKFSYSCVSQRPNTKITKTKELIPPDMYYLPALSVPRNNPWASVPSRSTIGNISPLLSHIATRECPSVSATDIQEAMEKEQECPVRTEDLIDYEARSAKTREDAPAGQRGMIVGVEVGTNETKDGESVEKTVYNLLGSVATEESTETNLSFYKSSGVDEHLAVSPVLEGAAGFVCVQSTEAPLHLEVSPHGATTDITKRSNTELASVTEMMATIEHFVPSPQRSHSVVEKSYATNPPMSDKGAGVDGDRHGVITDIPQCLNLEPNSVHSEPSALEGPRVAPQSFDEKQHRQTEDAFMHVTDKGIEVRPGETSAVRQVEVSESIVSFQVQQRGVDQKETPGKMSDNNCSMDGEGYGQQEALFKTVVEVKQEEMEVGKPVHGSLIPSLEPAAPVGQVCKAAECDPAQELGKERVWGVSLNSCYLATFPDRGAEPLPQALGKITENERSSSMGAESTNNLPDTQQGTSQLMRSTAGVGQGPLADTQLLDTKTQTQRMEAEAPMLQAGSETAATNADALLSIQAVGQGSLAESTKSQLHSSSNRHTATNESTSVVLVKADTESELSVPFKLEPGKDASSDELTVYTPNLTDTGRQRLHRPVIIVQRAAGPSEPQTSTDTTDSSSSTMEVSRASFTFSSLSTPETKDPPPLHVASNTYTFSSSSNPESKDGKQCYKVSIAGIPESSEHTIRSAQPISPTVLSNEELSDRMKTRYLAYQYKPNAGVRAFPVSETLDYHNQGVSSSLSYSSFSSSSSSSSSSAVPKAVPLEPARYTPHRFSSERREQPDMQPTSPAPALPSSSSPGNQRSWLSDRAEVQPSEPGGRSWAGLAPTPAGESSTEGGRETESVSEHQGEQGLYSGSDAATFLDYSSSSHSSASINSSGSSTGPVSPTVQLDSYSGVFKATRVELTPSSPTSSSSTGTPFSSSPTTSSTLSASPLSPQEPVSPHLETLKDTLKTMEKPARPRSSRLTGAPSLPAIKEDTLDSPAKEPSLTASTLSTPSTGSASRHTESILNSPAFNGHVQVSLPANLGLNWNTTKDMRSPLTLMKLQQQHAGLNLPLRASTVNSIVMRSSSFGEDDAAQLNQLNQLNGNTGLMSPSRLDNSLIFSSGYQPQQQVFQGMENGLHSQRGLYRAGSLPETSSMTHERISSAPTLGLGANTNHNLQANLNASRIERLSFLASPASSLNLESYSDRMSMPPSQQLNPLSDMNIGLGQVGQVSPLDTLHHRSLQRSYSTDSPLGSMVGTPLFNDISNGRGQQASQPEPEPVKLMVPKYRAFPDAYLTKEKEHGKLNPRPGKMIIYDQPGMRGERIEVRGDVVDATGWDFPDSISLRIIRGGWVLYEKPNFKGEKIALDEGDIETLSNPFDTTDEAHEQNGTSQDGEGNQEPETKKFVIGSIRRAVRDYSVPEISLFPEENAEGKKVVFRDTSEDARIFGFPIKANSIIINAGLWLVYAEPFFQGIPRVLEVGGFTNPAAWGVTQPYVSSLHPLKIGEPRVEKPNEPKLIIYDKPYFTGKSRELYTSMRDFMTRVDRQQKAFMYNAGSLKVIGGIWVGYEKEGFRGKQYLLEEGEYQDWRVWGGCDAELRSVRVIRADLTDPALVMYEFPDEQLEETQDERTFEVTEAIPDVELFGFHTNTRSIQVLGGAWVAYSHVDYSGNQYILEKGFYNNFADWGAGDNRICSLQPILMAPSDEPGYRNEVMLYSETDFQGNCKLVKKSEESLPESFIVKSCRVVGSSWVLYEGRSFAGNLYAVSEGDYPNLNSMGCPTHCIIRSIKAVPVMFAVPSISLFGLENFEGREITVDMEVLNLLEAGFNNHVLSVRVNSGCWVVCEHSNYRGRQFLLEPIEVTSWQKFSELTSIGSMYPIHEKRRFFRVKNKERGHYLSIQGGVEDMKSGRVVVMPEVEGMSDIWYYQDGLLKNKLSPTTSLQVMGNVEPGAKVVLWNETRMPTQIWSINLNGTIVSTTFPGMVLDIKGGKAYDRDHVVIREESEERPCQHWELELL